MTLFRFNPNNSIMHLPSKPAFSEPLRELIIESMKKTSVSHHTHGTTVTIEGPRFSSLAESRIFSKVYGADIVNMTTCPEVTIAKEMGLHYASIAMVTDYDCWKENEEVNVENVMRQMKEMFERIMFLKSINYTV